MRKLMGGVVVVFGMLAFVGCSPDEMELSVSSKTIFSKQLAATIP